MCKIIATIKTDNSASKRVFEKCGFLYTGTNGDFAFYALHNNNMNKSI
jgi:RimJ/RimL family protein N-acetyltransferase